MPPRRSSRAASASRTPLTETKPIKRKRGQTLEPQNASQNIETKPIKRKRGQTLEPHNVELEEDDDVEAKPPLIETKSIKRKRGRTPEPHNVESEEDTEDSDIQAPPVAQPRSKQNDGTADAAHVAVSNRERQPSIPAVEEEDLESLFDPPPMPGPSNLPRAIPEEPAGPKSRLVIHKMVLINFKSYAGKQEIGPFHKVTNIRQPPYN